MCQMSMKLSAMFEQNPKVTVIAKSENGNNLGYQNMAPLKNKTELGFPLNWCQIGYE